MQFIKTENRYLVRLLKGEHIISELTKFCERENITSGFFFGLGAVSSAELAFYNLSKKEYLVKSFDTPREIASLSGNVAIVENKPFIHVHATLSDENFNCLGGHLKEAIVGVTCEIHLTKENREIERIYDVETGLKLLECAV